MHIVPDSPSALPLLPGLNGRRLVLASASPRRKQLLSMLGIPFDVRPIGVDEVYPDTLSGPEIPRFLSELKARTALDTLAPTRSSSRATRWSNSTERRWRSPAPLTRHSA